MAALAVAIMSVGGLIPVATYVCPVFCALILQLVYNVCGKRIAWAWYSAVGILSLLLSPDKEAAATFVFLGYYPIVKPQLDQKKCNWLYKILLFNGSIFLMYWLLLKVLGISELSAEFQELGTIMLIIILVLGNITFILLDVVLGNNFFRKLGIRGS